MKIVKILLYLVIGLIVLVFGALVYLKTGLPKNSPPPNIHVKLTDEAVARGEYLANHVMLCMDCHAQRDWTVFAGPPKPGTLGAGGERFDEMMGFPGKFISPNITPTKLEDWSDGEIYKAITTGVSKDGRALFNVMPYQHYGKMDPEDIEAVIAYLRMLDPIENEPEKSEPAFPMNFIINTLPQKAQPSKRPNPENLLAYGEYLVNAAACYDCHTKQVKGSFVGEDFAGGMEFKFPDGRILRSPNITPHETGLKGWTKDVFVSRFKQYADSTYVAPRLAPNDFQTVMPWLMYAGMTEEDLTAIFNYLQSLKPVDNKVEILQAAI